MGIVRVVGTVGAAVWLAGCFTTRAQLQEWAGANGGSGDSAGSASGDGSGSGGGTGDSGTPTDDPCDGGVIYGGSVEDTHLIDGMALSRVCPHTFDMGCTEDNTLEWCSDSQLPVTPVTLTHAFGIGTTEVTRRQMLAVTGSDPSLMGCEADDCPAESVSWHGAADFTNRLSASAGYTECYACSGDGESLECAVAVAPTECNGYRLPTEAEWEAAARCGTDTRYAGSNSWRLVGVYYADEQPAEVASKEPNSCATWDMSGNISEWTQDWAAYSLSGTAVTDPTGARTGDDRVLRGGDFSSDLVENLAVYSRSWMHPHHYYFPSGIRIARTLD